MIKNTIKFFLFATAFTPLVYTESTFFPFVFGKIVFFRGIIEIALVLFLCGLIFKSKSRSANNPYKQTESLFTKIFKNPILLSILAFFVSAIFSTVLALNSYRAFWGDIERGDGLFGLIHLIVFMFLMLIIFERRDWINYFKITLGVGSILIFFAVLEYFGVEHLPFALGASSRAGSYIGNPAFFATQLIFLIGFSFIVFFDTYLINNFKKISIKFWKWFSIFIAISSFLTIFLTGTRGAILALFLGIAFALFYFSFIKQSFINLPIRKISLSILIVSFMAGGVFWQTRSAEFWRSVPGFSRLAVTTIGATDESTIIRVMTWKLSWEAFKDKPLWGWGLENYIYAYINHYNPDYAIYGETWLDRAHNKIFDVLVTQGLLGIISYLSIFVFAIYLLWKIRNNNNDNNNQRREEDIVKVKIFLSVISIAVLLAYFVQNLFLFDQINSYITFFALLGFIIHFTSNRVNNTETKDTTLKTSQFSIYSTLFYTIASGFVLYILFTYNITPFIQAQQMKNSPYVGEVGSVVLEINNAITPYNFSQITIRATAIRDIYKNLYFENDKYIVDPGFAPLRDILLKMIDDIWAREPYDIRILMYKVDMLDALGTKFPEYYVEVEKVLNEIIKMAPKRQEGYYYLAANLIKQNKISEAVSTAKKAVELSPSVARAHYFYGYTLAVAKKNDEAIVQLLLVEKLSPSFLRLDSVDISNYITLLLTLNREDIIANIVLKSIDGLVGHQFDLDVYKITLKYFAVIKDKENFIKVTRSIAVRFVNLKDDMATLADLAEQNKWDMINKL